MKGKFDMKVLARALFPVAVRLLTKIAQHSKNKQNRRTAAQTLREHGIAMPTLPIAGDTDFSTTKRRSK